MSKGKMRVDCLFALSVAGCTLSQHGRHAEWGDSGLLSEMFPETNWKTEPGQPSSSRHLEARRSYLQPAACYFTAASELKTKQRLSPG